MITHLHVVTVFNTEDVSSGVAEIVGQIDGAEHSLKDKAQGVNLQELAANEHPDVLIYQMNGQEESEFSELSDFISMNQSVTVIVVRKDVDVETTRHLMRLGVRDVIPFPMDQQELLILLGECLSAKRRRITDEHGNLAGTTSFINAKGGLRCHLYRYECGLRGRKKIRCESGSTRFQYTIW